MIKLLTFGVFDYFHLGHLRLFKNCKKNGDYLIVAVQNGDYILKFKPNAKIFYTTDQRVEMIEALKIVDQVIVYNSIDEATLNAIDFDVLCLGEDHVSERFIKAEQWCNEHGKTVVRMKRTPGISSTDIKENIK